MLIYTFIYKFKFYGGDGESRTRVQNGTKQTSTCVYVC